MKLLAFLVAAGVTLAVFLGVSLAYRGDAPRDAPADGPYRGSEPPGTHPLPDFVLRDYEGETVRSTDLEQGVFALTFLDAQCDESCPIIAAQIGQTFSEMPDALRSQVDAIALSTDPAEDTPEAVRDFLRRTRAEGSLRYLTSPAETLERLWSEFKILSSTESGHDALHSAPVRIYANGLWVATLHPGVDLTNENLLHDLRVAVDRSKEGQ